MMVEVPPNFSVELIGDTIALEMPATVVKMVPNFPIPDSAYYWYFQLKPHSYCTIFHSEFGVGERNIFDTFKVQVQAPSR